MKTTMPSEPSGIDRSSFLSAIRQAAIVSPDMVRKFDEICDRKAVRIGEHLYRQGECFSTLAINMDGVFRLYSEKDQGHDELTIGFVKPGGALPRMGAIKDHHELGFSIESLTKSTVITFSRAKFLELVETDIRWYRIIWNLLYEENTHREKRERSLLVSSAFARYQEFLTEYEDVEWLIKLKYIASYLGIQPATLSRIRSSPYRVDG